MKGNFIDFAKFTFIFFLSFVIGQLVKNPLEFALIDSNVINNLPRVIYPLFIAIPNFLFYAFVGTILSIVMKKRTFFWLLLFCILELSWKLYFLRQHFFHVTSFSGYMLMYFREIVIPFALSLGRWLHQKMKMTTDASSIR